MAQHTVATAIYAINIIFLLVALSVPHWSHGRAEKNNASGDVTIGLWMACASVGNEKVFNPDPTGSGDCRHGHCISSVYLTKEACALSRGLCSSSKGSAAFTLFAAVLSIAGLWKTTGHVVIHKRPSHGLAALFAALTFLSSLIAWAVWVAWQERFNTEVNCTTPTPNVVFQKLVPGAGVVLNIIVMLLCIPLFIVERRTFSLLRKQELEEMAARRQSKDSRNPLNPENPYDTVDNDDDDDEAVASHA